MKAQRSMIRLTISIPVFLRNSIKNSQRDFGDRALVSEIVPTSTDRDYEGIYYLPISAQENFPEIIVVSHRLAFASLAEVIAKDLTDIGMSSDVTLQFEYWGYGSGLFCVSIEFEENLDLAACIAAAQNIRDTWLNYRKVGDAYPLNIALNATCCGARKSPDNLWLEEFCQYKVSACYLIGVQLIGENSSLSDSDLEDLQLSTMQSSYVPLGVRYCAGNNNFLLSVCKNETGARVVLSYWKLLITLFGMFYEVDHQVSLFFRSWREKKLTARKVRAEIRRVRRFAGVFRNLLEDSTQRSLLDTEAEQVLLIGPMKTWEIEDLYAVSRTRIDMTKQAMSERMDEIQAYNTRVVGALLYFIAAVGFTNVFPIIYQYLSERGIISQAEQSVYEVLSLLFLLFVAALIYFWPRRL